MNERIKQLMDQAYDIVEFNYALCDNAPPEKFFNKEKFAELIVQECADVAFKYNRCDWADVSKSIKEHFGVEE